METRNIMPSPTDPTPAELIPSEPTAADSATPKWDKVEQERLTRRAALRKMGYTSGIALFSLFAVDDLARMAIKKMEQHKETRQIAETVAKEFKNSGIAAANSFSNYCGCFSPCVPPNQYFTCAACTWPCTGFFLSNVSCSTFTIPATATMGKQTTPCFACCDAQYPDGGVMGTYSNLNCRAGC